MISHDINISLLLLSARISWATWGEVDDDRFSFWGELLNVLRGVWQRPPFYCSYQAYWSKSRRRPFIKQITYCLEQQGQCLVVHRGGKKHNRWWLIAYAYRCWKHSHTRSHSPLVSVHWSVWNPCASCLRATHATRQMASQLQPVPQWECGDTHLVKQLKCPHCSHVRQVPRESSTTWMRFGKCDWKYQQSE